MTLREVTQNRILLAGAVRQGHDVPKEPVVRGDPRAACVHCGKSFMGICEDATVDVKVGRPIARCEKEPNPPPVAPSLGVEPLPAEHC